MQELLQKQTEFLESLDKRSEKDAAIQRKILMDGAIIKKTLSQALGVSPTGVKVAGSGKSAFASLRTEVTSMVGGARDLFTSIVSDITSGNRPRIAKPVPAANSPTIAAALSGVTPTGGEVGPNEESELEQVRLFEEQNKLLAKIVENTSGMGGNGAKSKSREDDDEGGSGGGLLGSMAELLGMGRRGGKGGKGGGGKVPGGKVPGGKVPVPAGTPAGYGAALGRGGNGGTGILSRGAGALGKLGPTRIAGALGIVAGGAVAYSGYSSASKQEKTNLNDVDSLEESGNITSEQAQSYRKEARDEKTVDASKAVGTGAGMAAGAAVGAGVGRVAGAVVGQTLIPIPVVGAAIGGFVGGIAGGWLGGVIGGKVGGGLGKKWGEVKNSLFSHSGESDKVKAAKAEDAKGGSVSVDFSEAKFAKADPESYAKFTQHRSGLVAQYLKEETDKSGIAPTEEDAIIAQAQAQKDSIIAFKDPIEAAGAGVVAGGAKASAPGVAAAAAVKEAGFFSKFAGAAANVIPGVGLAKAAVGMMAEGKPTGPVEPTVYGKMVGAAANVIPGVGLAKAATEMMAGNGLTPTASASASNTGNVITMKTTEVEMARGSSNNQASNSTVVSAPTMNNTTIQNTPIKLAPRNPDSTVNKYMQSRWGSWA